MKNYHHPTCIFQTFQKARATTKIIEVNREDKAKGLEKYFTDPAGSLSLHCPPPFPLMCARLRISVPPCLYLIIHFHGETPIEILQF